MQIMGKVLNMKNKMDNELEITRLKGTLEATKHYYAVLIAKNVEKVEKCVEKLEGYTEVDNEFGIEDTDEIIVLVKKANRAKVKKIKDLYLELAEAKRNAIREQARFSNRMVEIRNELKQVI